MKKPNKSKALIYGGLMADHVMEGKLDKLREQLEGGVSPDWRSNQFGDAVAMAVASRQAGSLKVLLDAGAQADATDGEGRCALTIAAEAGWFDCAKMLAEHGASLDGVGPEIDGGAMLSPAGAACVSGRPEILRFLFERGALVDSADHNGRTPLMLAAHSGNGECVKVCLAHGANVDAQENLQGYTPAMLALVPGGRDAMSALCEAGFNVNIVSLAGTMDQMAAEKPYLGGALVYAAWRLAVGERDAMGGEAKLAVSVTASKPRI